MKRERVECPCSHVRCRCRIAQIHQSATATSKKCLRLRRDVDSFRLLRKSFTCRKILFLGFSRCQRYRFVGRSEAETLETRAVGRVQGYKRDQQESVNTYKFYINTVLLLLLLLVATKTNLKTAPFDRHHTKTHRLKPT